MITRVPGFNYTLHDQTIKVEEGITSTKDPLFFVLTTTDKGPEELTIVNNHNNSFFKTYIKDKSTIFKKHGQPLLQACNIAENGGKMLIKRIVAEDSTLGNLSIIAVVTEGEVQKTDSDGNPLYKVPDTEEETIESVGNEPIMEKVCNITYEMHSMEGAKDIEEVYNHIEDTKLSENKFHLFTICDIGRGNTTKKIRISPNYIESRNDDSFRYMMQIYDEETILEKVDFLFNYKLNTNSVSRTLDHMLDNSLQMRARINEDSIEEFLNKVAEISENELEYIENSDILFGMEKRGNIKLKNINVNLEGESNLSYTYGIPLKNGSNGSLGDIPIQSSSYVNTFVEFLSGESDASIYDVDNYQIDVILDAGFDKRIKTAIEELAEYRQDLFFFRDLGIGLKNLNDIITKYYDCNILKSKYSATYINSGKVIDPYTQKKVPVTICYILAKRLIDHFKYGRHRPIAGSANNMKFNEFIKGSVNFFPGVTPSINQKEELVNLGLNYLSQINGEYILDIQTTEQEFYSAYSHINNVLAVQELIKKIRVEMPKSRYKFIESEDLLNYKKRVDKILQDFRPNFSELSFVYKEDPDYIENNIFYACIYVKEKKFAKGEYFDIFQI